MVTKWGYSDKLGVVSYGDNDQEVFLGMSMGRQQQTSEETAKIIDAEVRRLVEEGHAEARRIVTERWRPYTARARPDRVRDPLGDEIIGILKGVPPVRDKPEDKRPSGPSVAVPLTSAAPTRHACIS
jgi:cell division protease FtsH